MVRKKQFRNLIIVFGDQLNHDSAAFDGFDPNLDQVWMAEAAGEANHVWNHKYRLVGFFAPMRHFRDEMLAAGKQVIYHQLSSDAGQDEGESLSDLLLITLKRFSFERAIFVQPGDFRVQQSMKACIKKAGVICDEREDRTYYCSLDRFSRWAEGRRSFVLEQFYRVMRKEHRVMMQDEKTPTGDAWNFDKDNRGKFGKSGPGAIPPAPSFKPDSITEQVMDIVDSRFNDHPGRMTDFDLPVTRTQALELLEDFVVHRLPLFGTYQDAMWSDQQFLYHSRLSHAMNLKLLSPREVVEAAVERLETSQAPINSVEGFVRQILGWREYVRGIYWTQMPEYAQLNALGCDSDQNVPSFFWDGETKMACVADAMRLLIDTAYAHHIQRLMVLGLYAQLLGVHPQHFNDWHLAMYADAIDWVSLPNTLGMSQHADDGIMATKPYCASGSYIDRMGNFCKGCVYSPKKAIGEDACPITTLYWDFLARHRDRFKTNHRMVMQYKNLDRKDPVELDQILSRAQLIKSGELKV